jgi:hypothetical protein
MVRALLHLLWHTIEFDPLSWFSAVMSGRNFLHQHETFHQRRRDTVGTIWQGDETMHAVSSGNTGRSGIRVCFRNRTDQTLLLCWVNENGQLFHFYALEPYDDAASAAASSTTSLLQQLLRGQQVERITPPEDHVETTVEGHAFVIAAAPDITKAQKTRSLQGEGIRWVGGYRPEPSASSLAEEVEQAEEDDEDTVPYVHLVEISHTRTTRRTSFPNLLACCRPSTTPRTKQNAQNNDHNDDMDDENETLPWRVTVRIVRVDDTPVDSTTKHYEKIELGRCRWPVYAEKDWHGGDSELVELFERDLDHMASCLPTHAIHLLRNERPTPIWINKTLQYGPKACPTTGKGMCFHPEKEWLVKNGMHPKKCECVELYCAKDYKESRKLWGTGGVLIHEFSHAYHFKACENRYDNKGIRECYQQAMKDGLYDSVRVHGTQGPTAKAYACNNAMEYFAELSTAFLGGIPSKQKERGSKNFLRGGGEEEFNKWYPFTRKQIREHDPRAHEMLTKIWKVQD